MAGRIRSGRPKAVSKAGSAPMIDAEFGVRGFFRLDPRYPPAACKREQLRALQILSL